MVLAAHIFINRTIGTAVEHLYNIARALSDFDYR